MKTNIKYVKIAILIGSMLFLEACTTEPKVQLQSTVQRGWKIPYMLNWKNGETITAGVE